jgi:betaine-aldehyde dehydrogenase
MYSGRCDRHKPAMCYVVQDTGNYKVHEYGDVRPEYLRHRPFIKRKVHKWNFNDDRKEHDDDGYVIVATALGGKNPNIVFADADLGAAVDGVIKGFVYNAGAECCSGSRVLVQRSIEAKFTELLCRTLQRVTTGDPMDPNTAMGAAVSEPQFKKIQQYIQEGKKVATLAYGGKTLNHLPGFFIEPTVFTNVPPTAAIAREEVFGPVIAVILFDETADAAKLANDTDYGLAAALWTTSLDTAIATARRIKAGVVWINTLLDIPAEVPVGGVKHSGYGRENGRYAIEEYTVLKTVVLQSGPTQRYVRGIGI